MIDLGAAGVERLAPLFNGGRAIEILSALSKQSLPRVALSETRLLAPIDQQEVWAAGVTYLRSKKARMEESDFSASAYDRVYEAPRPELFFKSLPAKVSGPGGPVGIRADAKWNVPEPELALVFNAKAQLIGFTAGNDMSSRDIEGENLLYLPKAKTYRHSCALGPCLVLGRSESEVREWPIRVTILRAGQAVFEGSTSVGQIKRTFLELGDYLFRSQEFPQGAVLLTGTGIVPPDAFTLAAGDKVRIEIGEAGVLENEVVVV
ncbi:MAG: fumarylacetoacetate hydrolase family protein [Verrucomicrobia bacterium]|nr:fumarylacetoacetate hydrolase family protein [Verrucomicrobiota bacterium]